MSFFPERAVLKEVRRQYPEGQRVRLISYGYDPHSDSHDDNRSVPPGTEGDVEWVDDAGTVHVNWDNGRSLGVIVLANDQLEIL